jgi:hypothetical protein
VGQGRIIYIPAVNAAVEKPRTARMSSKYWKLPLNWKELIAGVKWAVRGRLSLEVSAPDTLAVVAELMEQSARGRRLVHLVNYAGPQGKAVSNVDVTVESPQGKEVRQVSLLTPDGGAKLTVSARNEQGRGHFRVPHLDTYTVAVLEYE